MIRLLYLFSCPRQSFVSLLLRVLRPNVSSRANLRRTEIMAPPPQLQMLERAAAVESLEMQQLAFASVMHSLLRRRLRLLRPPVPSLASRLLLKPRKRCQQLLAKTHHRRHLHQ